MIPNQGFKLVPFYAVADQVNAMFHMLHIRWLFHMIILSNYA